jgi:hypothetical protein
MQAKQPVDESTGLALPKHSDLDQALAATLPRAEGMPCA